MDEVDHSDEIIGRIFFKKYKVTKKLGQGSFGQVFKGINSNTNEEIAFKFEPKDENNNLLETEAYRLIHLKGDGVPKVICYGNNNKFNILVFQLLGKSLEDLFNLCGRKFSLKTSCILGIQMVERLQYVHDKCHIHRDIKPDNFVMGINKDENKVYVIDFGLAKKYKSQTKGTHIQFKTGKNMTGTARYCSVNTHEGFEQSRRDDLESIGHVIMYFLRGVLPWQGLKCRHDEDHYTKIYEKKKTTPISELCRGYPDEFGQFIKYCRELEFEGNPDYDLLIGLLKKVIVEKCSPNDPDYDWNNKLKSLTNLDIPKNNPNDNKKPNVSMLLNNKSTNSPYEGMDDTGISPNKNDLERNSIFQKEEKNELDDSIELPDENIQENQNDKEGQINKDVLVQANRPKNNDKENYNLNPMNMKNGEDFKKEEEKDCHNKNANDNQNNNVNNNKLKDIGKDKDKNKKGNSDQACKCVIF